MPVKHDASGRRSVEVEVEVPGTPEEVWRAIASGPGISSWFVPTELEERVGGTTVSHFGPDPDMASHATITAWEPPHRFAEEGTGFTPDAPPLATEWIVESRSGGTCVVRVVHSFFTSSNNWDDQLEAIESGWPAFFRILRLSLTHFRGQPSTVFQVMGAAAEPKGAAWQALTSLLGLERAAPGQRVASPAGTPPFAGLVEWAGEPAWLEELLLRLDEPAPGLAHLYAQSMGEQTFLTIHVFLFGEQTAATALRVEPEWQAWLNARFPMPAAELIG